MDGIRKNQINEKWLELRKKEDDLKETIEQRKADGSYFDTLKSICLGGFSFPVALALTKLIKCNGKWFDIDITRDYLGNHPDALAKCEEALGSSDINYIAGYLLGNDSLATALLASTGLKDFFVDIKISSLTNGVVMVGIGAMLPFVYTYAKTRYYQHQLNKTHQQIIDLSQEYTEEKRLDSQIK